MLQAITQTLRNPLTPLSFRRAGGLALAAALGLGLLITLFLAWSSESLALVFPVVLAGGAFGLLLFRYPLLNLTVLLTTFAVIVDYQEGTQVTEVLWGLYYLAFMGHWFLTRLFLFRERLFEDRESQAVFAFVVLMTLSVGLTLLFRGDLRFFMGEWLSLSFFALYFPIREAIVRYRHGLAAVLLSILLVALFVQVRNILNYQEILIEATYAWQVTKGRAVTNTAIIMVPMFGALLYLLHSRSFKQAIVPSAVFALFFGGFILSQTRGHWVAFVVAFALLLPVLGRTQRVRLVGIGLASIAGVVAVGYLVLGDAFTLVAAGLLDRVLSIGNAASQDISLINRFRETAVVMERVLQNPILGHGAGVTFRFWDLTFIPPFTHVTSFLHNGFVALWYKFGIWGLGLVLFVWGSAIRRGIRLYRERPTGLFPVTALGASSLLIAFAVSAATSNPFYVNDTMFAFSLVMGVGAGVDRRTRMGEAAKVPGPDATKAPPGPASSRRSIR